MLSFYSVSHKSVFWLNMNAGTSHTIAKTLVKYYSGSSGRKGKITIFDK